MCKPFDSYVDNGRIVIITTDYSELHGEKVVCENYIPISRAKEILKDLKEAIDLIQKSVIDEKIRLRKEKESNCKEHEFRPSGGKWSSVTERSCINCGLTID